MIRRFLLALGIVAIVLLLVFTARLGSGTPQPPQEVNVLSQTKGNESLKAELSDNQVRIRLKNNHNYTITAFAINFDGTTIKEEFAFSEVHFGIEPGDTFDKTYPTSSKAAPPKIVLLAVLLRNGDIDGNAKVAREIEDERLGEKIQILRTLKILEKEGQSHKDLKTTKSELIDALSAGESETLISLSELSPSRSSKKLSDDLKAGLQWGREKMLQRFGVLEKLPNEEREQGFTELKARTQKLFSKL
jgi:hypothetical protein